jgi:hypothetical protein
MFGKDADIPIAMKPPSVAIAASSSGSPRHHRAPGPGRVFSARWSRQIAASAPAKDTVQMVNSIRTEWFNFHSLVMGGARSWIGDRLQDTGYH